MNEGAETGTNDMGSTTASTLSKTTAVASPVPPGPQWCRQTWIQAFVVFVVVGALLAMLCPPFAARESSHDDLNHFRVDFFGVLLWSSIAAVFFIVVATFGSRSSAGAPMSIELVTTPA